MAEFMKRTALGFKPVPAGNSDPECTHVIMDIDEYRKLVEGKQNAENEAYQAKRNAEKKVEEIKANLQKQVNNMAREARIEAVELSEKLNEAGEKLKEKSIQLLQQQALNGNLLRIAKERANADRKLQPKKTHTGYVVVSSTERKARYRYGRADKEIVVWETVLQSPYSVDFPEEQARNLMEDLFEKDENDRWLICRIGINGRYHDGLQALKDKGKEWEEYNTAYECNIRANYKAGYWEIIIKHTKALGIVPKDMRAN